MGKIRVALGTVLAGLVITGLSHISFNVDILKLLPPRLKQVEGLSIFLKHFSLPNELIVTVEGSDVETVEASTEALAAQLRGRPDLVHRAVDAPSWESRPQDLAELVAYLLLNQAPEKIAELSRRLTPERAPEIARATLEKLSISFSPQQIAILGHDPFGLSESLLNSRFIPQEIQPEFSSSDGKFRVIYVEAATPLKNYRQTIAWIQKVKDLAVEGTSGRPVTLGFTGEPAFVADISGSMEWDMITSALVTLLVIGAIFWLCYRRVKPLLYLIMMLLVVFVISLGLAGLFLHQLTVIGVGFASIMIGLSVDYGYFIYQKSLHHQGTVRALQWESLQNIMWTAGTTAAAFFALNMSSLPGISQLGNLVGIGVTIGACVMLLIFAPITQMWKMAPLAPTLVERLFSSTKFLRYGEWFTGGLVALLALVLVFKGGPGSDYSATSLRPRQSGAYEVLDQLYVKLADNRDLLSLVVTGSNEEEVLARLQSAESRLREAQARGEMRSLQSALPFWPRPANQRKNLPILSSLASSAPRLEKTLLDSGFSKEAFAFTRAVLDQWAAWAHQTLPIWPTDEASRWILRRAASCADGQFVALDVARPAPGKDDALAQAVQADGVYLVSWNQLGHELRQVVPREFGGLILGLVGIVLVLLLIGFRSFRDVGLLVLTMTLVFLSLVGAMSLVDLTWNFFNLAAILLLLGTGIDYSILMLLAVRRNGGDVDEAQRSIGLVVALCAAAAAAGFGTIGWANNRGLASLGLTCAIGLSLDAFISIFLLPGLCKLSRSWPAQGRSAQPPQSRYQHPPAVGDRLCREGRPPSHRVAAL
jgi:uncharacterized protein